MMDGLAERLIAKEAKAASQSGRGTLPGLLVCERLRASLSVLAGREGFRSLLARAVALAGRKAAWVSELVVAADGTLVVPAGLAGRVEAEELRRGEVHLVATFLELLVMLIGVPLTHRLLQDIWPGLPPGEVEFRGEHP